jgi:hypothetical protein
MMAGIVVRLVHVFVFAAVVIVWFCRNDIRS